MVCDSGYKGELEVTFSVGVIIFSVISVKISVVVLEFSSV